MGYSSNPVSFWYLYSPKNELAAMILEVNNTFDERRMYLLLRKGPEDGEVDARFSQHWKKDFHVSPFSSRKGFYSLTTKDPFSQFRQKGGRLRVNATITLSSSKQFPKLIARVFSTGPPIDPVSMAVGEKLRFLARWWWVGLATIPRTVKEAAVLYFSKKMHVWYRPEPLKDTISCRGSEVERNCERHFRIYLRYLVETSTAPLSVTYIPAGLPQNDPCEIWSRNARQHPSQCQGLELRVLTPAFYPRYLQYTRDIEAMCREQQLAQTVSISDLELFSRLGLRSFTEREVNTKGNFHDMMYLYLVKHARLRPPELIERPLTSNAIPKGPPAMIDMSNFRCSPMDSYFLGYQNNTIRREYKDLVLRVVLQNTRAAWTPWMLNSHIISFAVAWAFSGLIGSLVRTGVLS